MLTEPKRFGMIPLMTNTIRLTAAQRSALECAGLEMPEPDQIALALAWQGRDVLDVTAETKDAIVAALTELANGEDALAEQTDDRDVRRGARGACAALGKLSLKVARA